jgi:hypothetical protein
LGSESEIRVYLLQDLLEGEETSSVDLSSLSFVTIELPTGVKLWNILINNETVLCLFETGEL